MLGSASETETEAGDYFVEDEQDPGLGGQLARRLDEVVIRLDAAHVRERHGFEDHRRDLLASLAENPLDCVDVAPRKDDDLVEDALRDAGAVGKRLRRLGSSRRAGDADEGRLVLAVVVALEAGDLRPTP